MYAISDQDDAGPWIRREFPTLSTSRAPSTQDGEQYYFATWTGISGDRFYRNAPGADFTTFTDAWVNANIRAKGPLGKHYPFPCCIHEGDTPSFLGLIDNGLASSMSPTYGGWGGRYVWRRRYGETRPIWTQGGDSYPGQRQLAGRRGRRRRKDVHVGPGDDLAVARGVPARLRGADGLDDQADARGEPQPGRGGERQGGHGADRHRGARGRARVLDAAANADPDGNALRYTWFFYPEAGTGIPGHPVAVRSAAFRRHRPARGNIPSAPTGGPPQPRPRVTIEGASTARATVTPRVAGVAHVILAVEDNGSPTLTSYRRVILHVWSRGPLDADRTVPP